MRSLLLVALVASLALAVTAAAAGETAVTILTPDNFDSVVGKEQGVFVEFFAPWCGHCKSLAPEYEIAAAAFSKFANRAVIASVDADAHRELGTRFEVKGFPSVEKNNTLKWFPAGSLTPETYSGGRTAADIVAFVNEKAGTNARIAVKPTHVVELTSSDFDKIVMDSSKDVLVEFYAPWCGHCKRLTPDYEAAAESLAGESGVVVAKVDADKYKEVGSRFGVTGFPTIKFFPKGNKEGEEYSGGRSPADFVKFFNEKSGTERILGGGFLETAGRVPELDAVAAEFVAATPADHASLLTRVQQAVKDAASHANGEFAKFYATTAAAIAKGKADFATREVERLTRMSSAAGKVTAKARAAFAKRINIVKQFIASKQE